MYEKCLDFVRQYDKKICQCDGNVVQFIWDTQECKTLLFLYYGRLKLWTQNKSRSESLVLRFLFQYKPKLCFLAATITLLISHPHILNWCCNAHKLDVCCPLLCRTAAAFIGIDEVLDDHLLLFKLRFQTMWVFES